MRSTLLGYALFVVVLLAAMLLLPTFYWSDTIATCFATVCVIRFNPKLSVLILSSIVIALTVLWPIRVLFWIRGNSNLSPLEYLTPTSLSNIINIIGFCLPTLAMIALVLVGRHRWRQ